jgi:hypothetical protein
MTAAGVILLVACVSARPAMLQPEEPAAPPEAEAPRLQEQEEEAPEEAPADTSRRRERLESVPEETDPEDPERLEEGTNDELEEGYAWGGRAQRPDPTVTAEGTLTLFMRSRNYRTIRLLRSVMTPALQASYERDSARFNGKQNVRLSAFYFQQEDLKPVRYAGPKGAREVDIYDATVRSLWTNQGEVADRRLERVRLAKEESGVWRAGRLDIRESDRSRYQEKIPSVTSLRKVLRAWHRRKLELADPLLTDRFVKEYAGSEAGLAGLFIGDPSVRHAAFEILEIEWEEGASKATASVDLYFTARNRFSALEAQPRRIDLVKVGSAWLVNSWEERQ